MKIQDIFNLPKNKGGAKLFKRIMNRYGIPKEDSKELKNNVDNSSSGGSSKVEYWGISDRYNSGGYLDVLIHMVGGYIKGIRDESGNVEIVNVYTVINHYENNNSLYFRNIKAFTFSPSFTKYEKYNTFNDVLKIVNEQGSNLYDLVYPITEEEFYNLN